METETKRSTAQNRSLHKSFTDISLMLVEQGIDQRTLIQDLDGYSAPVTPEFLKLVFKTIAWTMYRKDKTSDLSTAELTQCFDVFTKFLGENYGLDYLFPSWDSIAMEEFYSNNQ